MKIMIIAFAISVLIAIVASGVLSATGQSTSEQMTGDAVRLDEVTE
ncbi:hypothetical protein [Roseovarius sp. EL26]|nr:hypothetical protein [Roseovarius sp. EL26]